MTTRSVTHATFKVERTYDAAPSRVYNAFADPKQKAKWFTGPEEFGVPEFKLDFRIGGKELNRGGPKGGPVFTYEATYQDIVPNERIITTYDMMMDDKRISVSVATLEFRTAGKGTKLVLTEQGAFLDGFDTPAQREHGTGELLDMLGRYLAK